MFLIEKVTKVLRILLLIVGAGVALSACNTIEGLGRDVESVGQTVSDAAN